MKYLYIEKEKESNDNLMESTFVDVDIRKYNTVPNVNFRFDYNSCPNYSYSIR